MTTANIATGNFWDTGGVGFGSVSKLTLTAAPLPYVVAADEIYYIYIAGPTSAHAVRLWDVQFTSQFGN